MPSGISTLILSSLSIPQEHFITLDRLIRSVYYLPIAWRKFAITLTRVQAPIRENSRLLDELHSITDQNYYILFNYSGSITQYTVDNFADDLDAFIQFPGILSIISYVMKSEDFCDEDKASRVIPEGINKEISAALQGDKPQALSYSSLTLPSTNGLNPNSILGGDIMETWRGGVIRFITMLKEQSHIYIPIYQRRKNLGWDTQTQLELRKGMPEGASFEMFYTQLDILKWYHETGEKIGGPMEMRTVWRLNDLKPRVYYAGGGDAFWHSMHIKTIVLDLLHLLPSTHPGLRYDPTRLTMYTTLTNGQVVITYDYSSFTTSLAELKYFLSWLSLSFAGVVIRALDVFHGIHEIDLGEYIQTYNDTINVNATFDASRVHDMETIVMLKQTRNGMLGAQGNIGFSTLLHGMHIGSITQPGHPSSVVGDDALGRLADEEEIQTAITLSQDLCEIEPSKFHIWRYTDLYSYTSEDMIRQQYQYLKRPLNIDGTGKIVAGFLNDYPNIGLLDPSLQFSRLRSTVKLESDFESRIMTICRQWGSFLRRYSTNSAWGGNMSLIESEVILAPMKNVYRLGGIPECGAVPGTLITPKKRFGKPFLSRLFCPPVTPNVFLGSWELTLCRSYLDEVVSFPMYSEGSIAPPVHVEIGMSFQSTTHRIQRLMVDLGYFDSKPVIQSFRITNESMAYIRYLLTGAFGLRVVSEYTCLQTPPSWYEEVLLSEGDVDYSDDNYDKEYVLDDISQMLGI
uniref:RNA-dependent RNA polymerase n=1 Tax=Heterobasidion ambi-like virus 15 TaxID=3075969 RepID=A0AA96C4V9_9VIRU|nr:RNA-dependent RNA polymerase [Heterobasidion ambi-like virus 15]